MSLPLSGISMVSSVSTVMGACSMSNINQSKGRLERISTTSGWGIVIQTPKAAPMPAFISNLARATSLLRQHKY